jgi:hypothetical protein
VTDLRVSSSRADVLLSPSIEHAMFPAGAVLEIAAYPRLSEGFKGVAARLTAKAVGQEVSQELNITLGEKDKLFSVALGPARAAEGDEALLRTARLLAGTSLDPKRVDWSRRQDPQDLDGDGRPDRWIVEDRQDEVLWVGNDSDGDGAIDFVHADLGGDGLFDYAALLVEGRWEPTTLLEAWLELSFKLPWARELYEKHDVAVVFNGKVVGRLREVIPEGNYAFRLPPSALRRAAGAAAENQLELRSQHLGSGHYVVSSAFRLKFRLLGAHVWSVAGSAEEARKRAEQAEGLSLTAPDYSVSSAEFRLVGPVPLTRGADVAFVLPLRNLGAARAPAVTVALLRSGPGRADVEWGRVVVEDVPLFGAATVRIPWTAAAGTHRLRAVVDPDGETKDRDRANNEAVLTVSVPGDDAPPTLEVLNDKEGQVLSDTVVVIRARAADDSGIARVEARIDDGLWQPLVVGPVYQGRGLLQPGQHQITVRAVDSSGNQVARSFPVKVTAEAPALEFVEPPGGREVAERRTAVKLKVGADAVLAAVRSQGGPWQRLPVKEGVAEGMVPLPFGAVTLEAMAASRRGAVRIVSTTIRCSRQPGPGEGLAGEREQLLGGVVNVEGLGAVDLFGPLNTLVPGSPPGAKVEPRGAVKLPFVAEPVASLVAALLPPPAADESVPVDSAMVTIERITRDWYCTNRPAIAVGFRVPDWVMGRDLPRPGTAEYDEVVRKLLARWKALGLDTTHLEKLYDALMRRVKAAEQPQQLSTGLRAWLEAIGLQEPAGSDPESLRRWRERMLELTQQFWLRLLASEDPDLMARGLRARLDAFRKFDDAMQESAEGALAAIGAYQKLIQDVLELTPVVGDALDLHAAATGETLSGEKLSALERMLRGAAVLTPALLDSFLKRGVKQGDEVAETLSELADSIQKDPSLRQQVAKFLGKSEDELLDAAGNLRKLLDEAPAVKAGKVWEAAVILKEGGVDLNKIRANFPIVDMVVGGRYVSIADARRESKYLLEKFQILLNVGTTKHTKMLKELGKFEKLSDALPVEEFLKKAELLVPTTAQAKQVQKWIAQQAAEHGLPNFLDKDVYKNLQKLWGSDAQIIEQLQKMVRAPR